MQKRGSFVFKSSSAFAAELFYLDNPECWMCPEINTDKEDRREVSINEKKKGTKTPGKSANLPGRQQQLPCLKRRTYCILSENFLQCPCNGKLELMN